jgi:uroporphyrinogen decarboxylase
MAEEKHLFLKALRCEPVPRPPVWLMRQAGRYLPEYQAVRAQQGDFMSLCRSPEAACKVSLQPITRYGLDAAIIFSDILIIPDAMGLGVRFLPGKGVSFSRSVVDRSDVRDLKAIDPAVDLRYVLDAIGMLKRTLAGSLPVIGFAGSPWTLAAYMVEGKSSPQFMNVRRMLYDDPGTLKALLARLTESVADLLIAQAEAGADALMLFDSWASWLSYDQYMPFSLDPMRTVIERVHAAKPEVPIIVFAKGGLPWIESLADSGCQALGLDWTVDLPTVRKQLGNRKIALQGNLDPALLYAPPQVIHDRVRALMKSHPEPGLIVNLGHGVLQDTHVNSVATMVHAVRHETVLENAT